jgi:hypothetical protein
MSHVSFRTKNVQHFLAALFIVAVLDAGAAPPASAQNTAYGTGALASDTTGTDNTAFGFNALNTNFDGVGNTATGTDALKANNGVGNTATGASALSGNTTGGFNTATGDRALYANTTGADNTASGGAALYSNTTGYDNTAAGDLALYSNTTGDENTATGYWALAINSTGFNNTATGYQALVGNSTGFNNTASGSAALFNNTTGPDNTASGSGALSSNTTGSNNIGVGAFALNSNTTGSNNVGVGVGAGGNLTTGSDNIEIGNVGVAGESNTIRIGTKGAQTRTFVVGVNSSAIYGVPVMVNVNGRLGIQASSARYKREIHNMGDASTRLLRLRPVSFRYREDPKGTLQYGLIAEEVERIYPELVIRDDDGRVMGVRYDMLPALLLNEVQKLEKENQRKNDQIAALQEKITRIDTLAARLNALEDQARKARPEHMAARDSRAARLAP